MQAQNDDTLSSPLHLFTTSPRPSFTDLREQGAPNFTTSVTRTAKAAGEYSRAKIEREAREVKEDLMSVFNSAKQVAAFDPNKVAEMATARAKAGVMGKMKLPKGMAGGSVPARGSTSSSSAAGGAATNVGTSSARGRPSLKTMSLDRSKLNFRSMATSKLSAHASEQANAKMGVAAERAAQQGIESTAPGQGQVSTSADPTAAASQKGMMGRYRNKKKLLVEVEARKAKARPKVVGPDGKVIVAKPKTDRDGRRHDSGDIWC